MRQDQKKKNCHKAHTRLHFGEVVFFFCALLILIVGERRNLLAKKNKTTMIIRRYLFLSPPINSLVGVRRKAFAIKITKTTMITL